MTVPTTIGDALALAAIAALVLVCRVAWHAGTWLPELLREVSRAKLLSRQVEAADQAVAAAEERSRTEGQRGEAKLSLASQLVSGVDPSLSVAPSRELLQASVARLRASSSAGLAPVVLPAPQPGAGPLSIVVTTSSGPPAEPPPIPRPARTGFSEGGS